MGFLSGDTPLTVIAYDKQGNASVPWKGTVKVISRPSWVDLQYSKFVSGNNAYYALSGWRSEDWGDHFSLAGTWGVLGQLLKELETDIRSGVVIRTRVSLDGTVSPSSSQVIFAPRVVICGIELSTFEKVSFLRGGTVPGYVPPFVSFGFDLPKVRPVFSKQLEIIGGDLTASGSLDFDLAKYYSRFKLPLPKDGTNSGIPLFSQSFKFLWPVISVPGSFDFSFYLKPGIDWGVTVGAARPGGKGIFQPPTYFTPRLAFVPRGTLNLVDLGVFAGGLYVEPSISLNWAIGLLDADPQMDLDFYISALVCAGVSLKVGTFKTSLNVLTLGPYESLRNEFGDGERTDRDALPLNGPDVVTLPDGRQLLTFVADSATSAGTKIAYQVLDNQWSPPLLVSTDGEFIDQFPSLAVTRDGKATVVWSRIPHDPNTVADKTLEEILRMQEIYYATFDGNSWSAPAALTSNAFADGLASIAYAPDGTGLTSWVSNAGSFANGANGSEIAFSFFDGTMWKPMGLITTDSMMDRSVDLAYTSDGIGTAVWIHEAAGDTLLYLPYFATWNGASWSTPEAVPGTTERDVRCVQVAPLSNGRLVVVWSEAGTNGVDLLSATRFDDGTWSPVEMVASDLALVDGLQLEVNGEDTAFVVFHGTGATEEIVTISRAFGQADSKWTTMAPVSTSDAIEWMPAATVTQDNDLFVVFAEAALADGSLTACRRQRDSG